MTDREMVIKGLECCINGGYVPNCEDCPYAGVDGTCLTMDALFCDALELLKAMWCDLQATKSCAVCRHRDECDPNADEYDPAWQRFHDCGGPFKLNWKWRGPTEEAKEVAWYV